MDLQLSLRPQQSKEESDNSLPALLARIHAQRGPEAFREFTEESLQAEIDGKDKEELPDADTVKPEDDFDISEEVKAKRAKLEEGRFAILGSIGSAIQETQISLDYISFILTQYQPEIAAASLSPGIKEQIPVKCLSLDRVMYDPSQNELKQHKILARTWKTEALNSSAELLRNAGERIGREAEKEKRFWGEVMGIKERGWTIAPRRGGVSVRYGFTEASTEFKRQGSGPLKRGEDGGIIVEEVNMFSGKEKHLRVRCFVAGELKGSATRQFSTDAATPVESEILKARDNLFETELFFELQREARTLASHNIHTSETAVTLQLSPEKAISIDLISETEMSEEEKLPRSADQIFTEGVSLGLRILLCNAHAQVLALRSQPPNPLGAPKNVIYPLPILRPLTTYLHHTERTIHLRTYLSQLINLLTSAGLPSSYTVRTSPPNHDFHIPENPTSAQIVSQFTKAPYTTTATLSLPGPYTFTLTQTTQITPPIHGTIYLTTPSTTPPSSSSSIRPTALKPRKYTTFEDLKSHLDWIVEMSVLQVILNQKGGWEQVGGSNEAVCIRRGSVVGGVKVGLEEEVLVLRGENLKKIVGRWDGTMGLPGLESVVEGLVKEQES